MYWKSGTLSDYIEFDHCQLNIISLLTLLIFSVVWQLPALWPHYLILVSLELITNSKQDQQLWSENKGNKLNRLIWQELLLYGFESLWSLQERFGQRKAICRQMRLCSNCKSHKRSEKADQGSWWKKMEKRQAGNIELGKVQGIWNLRGGVQVRWWKRELLEYLENTEYDLKNASFLCSMGECRMSTVRWWSTSAGPWS